MQYQTHDLGNLFVQRIRLKKKSPLFHRAVTNETEYPFRTAYSNIIRVPGTEFGLVFGHWEQTDRTEEEALLAAVEGVWYKSLHFSPADEAIEAIVEKYSLDGAEEETFKKMLGVYNDAKSSAFFSRPKWQGESTIKDTQQVNQAQ